MKSKSNFLVTKHSFWNFTNETTGELMKGCTVLGFFEVDSVHTEDSSGLTQAKFSVDEGLFLRRLKGVKVPAIFEVTTEMAVDSKGKPTLKLVDLEFKKSVSLFNKPLGSAPL